MAPSCVHLLRVVADVAQTWQDTRRRKSRRRARWQDLWRRAPCHNAPPPISLASLSSPACSCLLLRLRSRSALADLASSARAAGRQSPPSHPLRAQPDRRSPAAHQAGARCPQSPARTMPALVAPTSTRLRASPSASTCFGCHRRGRMDQVARGGG